MDNTIQYIKERLKKQDKSSLVFLQNNKKEQDKFNAVTQVIDDLIKEKS